MRSASIAVSVEANAVTMMPARSGFSRLGRRAARRGRSCPACGCRRSADRPAGCSSSASACCPFSATHHVVAFAPQHDRQQLAHRPLVVDDEQAAADRARRSLAGPAAAWSDADGRTSRRPAEAVGRASALALRSSESGRMRSSFRQGSSLMSARLRPRPSCAARRRAASAPRCRSGNRISIDRALAHLRRDVNRRRRAR